MGCTILQYFLPRFAVGFYRKLRCPVGLELIPGLCYTVLHYVFVTCGVFGVTLVVVLLD